MDTTTLAIIICITLIIFFAGWVIYHVAIWIYEYQHGPCFRGLLKDYRWPCKVPQQEWAWDFQAGTLFRCPLSKTGWCGGCKSDCQI